MIVVRNVFQLKFGKAKEAVAAWKDGMALARKQGFAAKSMRVLTDLVGPFYTLVFETTFDSLNRLREGQPGADGQQGVAGLVPQGGGAGRRGPPGDLQHRGVTEGLPTRGFRAAGCGKSSAAPTPSSASSVAAT